jgi:hypothetical protein
MGLFIVTTIGRILRETDFTYPLLLTGDAVVWDCMESKGVVDHNTIVVAEKTAIQSESKSDYKRHWSTTENGALVARATSFVYRKIIASEMEGGLKVQRVIPCILSHFIYVALF